jgi:hypothetical protein
VPPSYRYITPANILSLHGIPSSVGHPNIYGREDARCGGGKTIVVICFSLSECAFMWKTLNRELILSSGAEAKSAVLADRLMAGEGMLGYDWDTTRS